jgi:plasmid stabilization system protein ParE
VPGKKEQGQEGMSFQIVMARIAAREIKEHYHWLGQRSATAAERWRDSLLDAITSLEVYPERFPEAPEAEYHQGLRQLLHGKRRHVHRILFEVRGDTVIILRVRHAAQNLLAPGDL